MLLVIAFFPTWAFGQSISIKDIEITREAGVHQLNAKIDYVFSEQITEALHHGVDIYMVVEVLVKQQRQYLWDKTHKRSKISYKLEYHPLSERYVLTNLNEFNRVDFQYLKSALDRMGDIQQWQILHQAELNPDAEYSMMVRAKLDIESLPAPLRLLAFISNTWQLRSDWYQWQLVI